MPLDRVGASVATFDFLYLPEVRKAGRVAPTVGGDLRAGYVVGGTVLDSRAGIFGNVAVLDFKSLYPSIIRTFGIDPVAFTGAGDPEPGELVAPNGARFRREGGILPRVIERLWERRDRAKAEGDRAMSMAAKLLMNSFYGVLGTNSCRFASAAIANAITSFGGEILRRTKREIEGLGHEVIYGDTDSVFVLTGAAGATQAREVGERIRDHVNQRLAEWAREEHDVESRLELELEKIYRRFFLPNVRGGGEGSKKRYAGDRETGGEPELELVGLEAVRRDWPEAGRRFQTELLRRAFRAEDVDGYVFEFVRSLRRGELDAELVYRKVLRKDPDEYVKASPPHVRAARRAGLGKGAAVRYVIRPDGPTPVARDAPVPSGLDYDHYVSRVLEPIADAILPFLGKRFDEISGDDPQLTLF
jgi:DNA polymerase-2